MILEKYRVSVPRTITYLHLLKPFSLCLQSLLGQKYGEQVLPCKILAEEFEALYPFVKQEDDRDILESWYLRDDNHIPPVYVLQPITAKIAGFLDNDKGKRKDVGLIYRISFFK